MRPESNIQWNVRGKIFGGERMLECVPVISQNEEEWIRDVREIAEHKPDVLEWRIDYYDQLDNPRHIQKALEAVDSITSNIPILLTFRHVQEGGVREVSQQTRLQVIQTACETGKISMVDVELANDPEFLEEVKAIAQKQDVRLLLSYHDFMETPSEEKIIEILAACRKQGADAAKVSVMAQNFGDVLVLAKATRRAKKEIGIPLIMVSMGAVGSITRLLGGVIGSDLTFLCAKGASGPGQIDIEEFRQMNRLLEEG